MPRAEHSLTLTYHMGTHKSRKIVCAQGVGLQATGDAILRAVRGDPTARNEAAIRASALLLVTRGRKAAASPLEVNMLMTGGQWFRSQRELRLATGGERAVIKRIVAGGVIPLSSLGKWTPDFWFGLVSSGAIRAIDRPQQWLMEHPDARPFLVASLTGDVPFRISWSRTKRGLLMWSLWVARMGPDDPEGVGVLAGLLAGGRRIERGGGDGESWLGIAWRGHNAVVLEKHFVPYIKVGRVGNGMLLVSPFWGALLANEMPVEIGEWFRLWGGRKGMCPLLPWAFLAYAWGVYPGKANKMVPFAIDPNGMLNAGIGIRRKVVRRVAFERFGMTGVSSGIRTAWLKGLVARGVRVEDFPEGKVPLDFESHLCHTVGVEGKAGQDDLDI